MIEINKKLILLCLSNQSLTDQHNVSLLLLVYINILLNDVIDWMIT